MTGQLRGKTIVVTGGSAGIGRGIAEVLFAKGADVVADLSATDGIVRAGGAEAGQIASRRVDVADPGSIAAFFRHMEEGGHRLDAIVNTASGEFVVFVGPSGCGKSTLLRAISGLETIDGGALVIDGARSTTRRRQSAASRWSFSPTRCIRI